MAARITSARFAPCPSGDRPASHEPGIVDDENRGVVEVVLERSPRALQEERVSDCEHGLAGQLLLSALHRDDDEVSALRDHSREGDVADERRAWRDDHLGKPGRAREEPVLRSHCVLLDEGAGVLGEVLRDRTGAAVREEPVAEEQDDCDRPGDERHTGEREREVAEAPDAGVVGVFRRDHVDR
jgi:hypothetical protein